ncbi:LytR/AlgR family response regulator transcription factor [Gemella cuniculi]|uniref:LytR/AlgR family response regulator transcription factor n=1 Tax=Gemella cuniculi TaxID=150240 RepID=UPI000411C3D5|nr:LytTR family DNA-binding domain-containing protein [Gemella cuniculi]
MKIIICEDNKINLTTIYETIKNTIIINDWDISIELITQDPNDVVDYIDKNKSADCYFLDIDLGTNCINGIELGKKIRNVDCFANIVYITYFDKMRITVINETLSPLNYIIKETDTLKEDIVATLEVAYNRYLSSLKTNLKKTKVPIKVGNRIVFVDINNILYFEAMSNHKILLKKLDNTSLEFYGKLLELEKLNSLLFLCHRSYLINISLIKEVTKEYIIFKNESTLFLSNKILKRVNKELEKHNKINL